MRVLWAWHDDDPEDESGPAYHGANRGVRSTVLLSNNTTSDNFKETNYTTVDLLMNNVSVPAYQDTTYWCQVFELPELASKHHIIKFEPIISPGSEGVVHHLIIYTCTRNRSVTFLPQEHPGHECRTPNMPRDWYLCLGGSMLAAWGIGAEPMTYPAHVGYPIGDADGSRYVLLEQHYDNPQLVSGIRDSSGLRLTVTPELRDNDLGVFEVGMPPIKHHVIPPHAEEFKSAGFCNPNCLNAFLKMLLGGPNSRHIIPPRDEGFKSAGFCNTNCLNAFLEELGEPIHIIGLELHSHLLAVKMSARLIHNGKEIEIARDDNYDFNLQFFRMLKEEVTVYPGDTLVTECTFRSTHKDKGGPGTPNEMCQSYIIYYPQFNLTFCESLPNLFDTTHFAGVQSDFSTSSDFSSGEMKITAPERLVNMSFEAVMEAVPWTDQKAQEFSKRLLGSPFPTTPIAYPTSGLPLIRSGPFGLAVSVFGPSALETDVPFPRGTKPVPENVCSRRTTSGQATTRGTGLAPATLVCMVALIIAVWKP
ncbi:hypothetical protein Bbelb_117060 [Branchiostoma belcheri]|nr:hypothetical protein Bbelb_117060 [Branchiostoma belcheri]